MSNTNTSDQLSTSNTTSTAASFDETGFARTFTHYTADVNGTRLHYVMGGKGDPVVLLHGFPQTWYEWRKIMPILAERYTVIAPDIRGFGDSAKPTSGYDGRNMAEDIHQLVRQLGFERIFLVAHDMGTIVAFPYAAAYPEEVRCLAVLELTIPGFGLEEMVKEGGFWWFGLHQAPNNLAEELIAGRERAYLSWFLQGRTFDPAAITDEDVSEFERCYSQPGALSAAFSVWRALPETIQQNREAIARGKMQMPVLALGADQVMKTAPLESLQRVAVDVRGGEVERCGHFIPDERPEELAQQLFAFFDEEK